MKKPLLLALFTLCAFSLPAVWAQPEGTLVLPTGLPLKTEFHLKAERFGMPAVQVGTDVYVIGGFVRTGFSGSIECIDTTDNTVETIATNVLPRGFGTAEAIGDKIYIFGGLVFDEDVNDYSEEAECFNTKTGEVTKIAPFPALLRNLSSAVVDGKIYAVGGGNQIDVRQKTLWIYDPKDNEWTKGAPMRVARECDVVAKDGTLYAIGGFDGQNAVTTCEAYDIASNTWSDLPNLPVKTSAHHLAISDDAIWTFGDYTDMNRVQRFDFKTQTWQLLAGTGYTSRRHNAVCMVGNNIYVIGGNISSGGSYLDTVQVFDATKLK